MTNPKLSIVVPSYNETADVKKAAINSMAQFLQKQNYSYEVLIVDDQSTNNTVKLVEEEIKKHKNFHLLKNTHGGKAITVMTGLLASKGEIALFTVMDQATPINQVEGLFPKFGQRFDVVIGIRHGRKGAPPIRKLSAVVFQLLRNIILGLPFVDTQCGFKAFNRQAVEAIFPDMLEEWKKMRASGASVNAGFDVEMLFIAKQKKLKIAEVEVEWQHVENIKLSQLIKNSLEAIKDMFRIRVNQLAGKYG